MNPESPESPDVESLVRAYLDDQARTVDPQRVLAGIDARARKPRPGRSLRRWGIGLAAAAGILIALSWNSFHSPARLEAAELVREARDSARALGDRCYRVRVDLEPGAGARFPFLALLARSDVRLWTRSDRRRVDLTQPDRAWSFGLDDRRRVWVAPTSGVGLLFEPEEVPPQLGLALDLCGMDLQPWLDRMLTDCDLSAPPDDDLPPGQTRIRGKPRTPRPNPRFRSIVLVIDDRTKLVRRVTLSRVHLGQPVAEITFEFEESRPQPDDQYRLDDHLDPGAPVFGKDQPLRRRRQLARFFGTLFGAE